MSKKIVGRAPYSESLSSSNVGLYFWKRCRRCGRSSELSKTAVRISVSWQETKNKEACAGSDSLGTKAASQTAISGSLAQSKVFGRVQCLQPNAVDAGIIFAGKRAVMVRSMLCTRHGTR